MTKSTVQLIVVLVIVGVWVFALLLAQFDGNTMLKVVTPIMTMMTGWLFAAKVTEA